MVFLEYLHHVRFRKKHARIQEEHRNKIILVSA